jgi:hypothetical protein
MRAVKASGGRSGAATPSFSTSVGRANFAAALELTDEQKTVVGFDRYSRPVAALVPIEAVSILAGLGNDVDPAVRAKIVRMAKLFVMAMPAAKRAARGSKQAKRAKAKKAKKAAKKKKAAKRAKARSGARRKAPLGNGA